MCVCECMTLLYEPREVNWTNTTKLMHVHVQHQQLQTHHGSCMLSTHIYLSMTLVIPRVYGTLLVVVNLPSMVGSA